MITAHWKDVGVLVGELIASEPPFVQICVVLAAAFGLLMIVEGLRASFARRRDEPVSNKSVQLPPRVVAATNRIAQGSSAARKLPARAIKPHRAPRPKIQRKPLPDAQAEPLGAAELPQVASFEE